MHKVKITYRDYDGKLKAKIINSVGIYNLQSDFINNTIDPYRVTKIELLDEVDPANIIDLTQ